MICSRIFKKKTRGVQEGRIKKYPTISKISSGFKEASPGFEPGIRVLQTRALPLGYDAEKAFLIQSRDVFTTSPDQKAEDEIRTRDVHLGKVTLYH